MKRPLRFLAIFLVALPVMAQIRPDEERERRAKNIERAAAWLLQEDRELREIARQQLVEFGRDAVPVLERKVEEKGLLDVVRVLRTIDGPRGGEPYVAAKDLAPVEEPPKLDRTVTDKYVQARYAEAMEHARKGNYQRGYDLANALMVLEGKSATADRIRTLRRYCENMITQTTLLEAKVIQDRTACVAGDTFDLTLRMRNLYRSEMKISYADGTAPPPDQGMAVIEIRTRVYDMENTSIEDTRTDEVRFETEIPVATGAQWERRYTLDTRTQFADGINMVEMTVNAWTHPLKIETDGRAVTRRIQFEPAVVKVLPKACAKFLENPLEWLQKTIEAGVAQETFLCSQLLEGKEKEAGIEMVIRAMERKPEGRVSGSWILVHLTGERLGNDPKKWREWLDSRGKKTKK